MANDLDPRNLIVPRRRITGISAILLPFVSAGQCSGSLRDPSSVRGANHDSFINQIDWPGFDAHVLRTATAGLTPAVNMDTGYGNLLDDATRRVILERTRDLLGGAPFVAGAFVGDSPDSRWSLPSYQRQIEPILACGGTPVIFPSYGLNRLDEAGVVAAHRELARYTDRFIAFELGQMFVPFGRIYELETFQGLMDIPQCIGAKHSSLRRDLEWQRLILRNHVRPDFRVFTGNDLAIDMVMYGSDYLLGLSTFAPEEFARRDRLWEQGDPAFFELNDTLQYLGNFAFREPVPAYKHSAAMFLHLRGWIQSDLTHPSNATRPTTDRPILADIARRLGIETRTVHP
ncbi:MAG: dihydrodipicolinate synthase family protein [Planctomycetaceae bacterium]|nr:dihydrodipicolinate synthase family protein [Planctomycetaceae bacterium]